MFYGDDADVVVRLLLFVVCKGFNLDCYNRDSLGGLDLRALKRNTKGILVLIFSILSIVISGGFFKPGLGHYMRRIRRR
jgi:hypothetical protein